MGSLFHCVGCAKYGIILCLSLDLKILFHMNTWYNWRRAVNLGCSPFLSESQGLTGVIYSKRRQGLKPVIWIAFCLLYVHNPSLLFLNFGMVSSIIWVWGHIRFSTFICYSEIYVLSLFLYLNTMKLLPDYLQDEVIWSVVPPHCLD